MINGQLNEFATGENLTQVASYFDIVDNAIKTGDTNKRYSISTNTSTAPNPPFPEGSWTHIHISPTADNMCDLYNSYIIVQFEFTMAGVASSDNIAAPTKYTNYAGDWFGYKDALDCIESYQIVSNGNAIYTQSHCCEESYITNLATPDTVRNTDIFQKATAKNIWNRQDVLMTGQIMEFSDTIKMDGTNATIYKMLLKIDLRRFLPLSGVKYLPAFVGNLELRVKFSKNALVKIPLPHTDYLDETNQNKNLTCIPKITNCFTPLHEPITGYTGLTACKADGTVDATAANNTYNTFSTAQHYLKCSNMEIKECKSVLACFGIDDGIYQSLVQRYTNQSLSFPTQTLTFQAMNGTITSNEVQLALTSTPRFVDTIFMLFPKDPNYRTCFYNPLFAGHRLIMGGYGSMPDIPTSSYGVINYEMLQNALNMNNDSCGLNEDVMRSASANADLTAVEQLLGVKVNDCSNFVLAYPVSTDNTFQQGQTSAAPITYQFKAEMNTNSIYSSSTTCTPIMGFLKDSVFAIQLRPDGPPICAVDEFDISSPMGS